MSTTLYTGLSEIVTNRGVARKGGVGVVEEDLGIIRDGALLWDSNKGILWMGHSDDSPRALVRKAKTVKLLGKTLSPALADCHTHLVHAGTRVDEFRMKLSGASYQQIAASGGGIVRTVSATRKASEAELLQTGRARIEAMQKMGVGLLEMKSGYGLDWNAERKQLRVARRLQKDFSKTLTAQSTFLGAHDFPPEAKSARDKIKYATLVADTMLAKVKKEKLADACDIFMDDGYYTRSQARRILQKAHSLGMEIKIHADELADTGGASLAAELGCLSADHLLKANEQGITRMAARGVVAVLLPGTAFYLRLPYAPVEKMRKAGICFAIASDFNPGSSPSPSLPFAMSLACLQMKMTPAEVFAAATYGGARAMGMHGTHGYLRVGAKPRIAIFDRPSYACIMQEYAHPGLCEKII